MNRRTGSDLARRALRVAADGPDVLAPVAYLLGHFGERIDVAIGLIDRVLAFKPSFAHGRFWSGYLRLFAGQPEVAIEHFVRCRRLSPRASTPPQGALPIRHGEAERRQITAMSCELVGMTARLDGMDLEDLHETVGDFQRCVSEAAERHQGFVHRDLGSSALVLFGYPEAHEYDAEQAIRAGLELCAAVRSLGDVPVRCRVGIATGLVIVGDPVGDGAARGEKIIGDAPNQAARLAAAVQPDTVAVGPATRRLIGSLFECRELGAIAAAGGGAPIRNWQVLGESVVESRFEALRGSALSPLIGRDEEIGLLLRRWGREGPRRPGRADFRRTWHRQIAHHCGAGRAPPRRAPYPPAPLLLALSPGQCTLPVRRPAQASIQVRA